jgi:heme/copper-type cytochrome/quinol oxidase subunit 2
MTGFVIIMVTVAIMAVGAAVYFRYRDNETTKAEK